MKKRALAGLLATCALAAGVAPALAGSEGTVSAQVTVAAPCIQISPAQLDFGTLGLSQDNVNLVSGTRPVTATNCGAPSTLFGRGSNATSTGGTTWTLTPGGDVCPSPNNYVQRVDTGGASIALSSQNSALRALAGGGTANLGAIVVMPCAGSSGAGQIMTFSYVFTAVLG
jgi:hypothetical protein